MPLKAKEGRRVNSIFNFGFMATNVGRKRIVARETPYGLDGPLSNRGWIENFSTSPDGPWGPDSPLYNG